LDVGAPFPLRIVLAILLLVLPAEFATGLIVCRIRAAIKTARIGLIICPSFWGWTPGVRDGEVLYWAV
jgi:hypothetical protein